MEAPGYWDDPEKSQEGMKELKNLKDEAEDYRALEQQYEDIETLIEMGNEEPDPELVPEVQEELEAFAAKLDSMTIKTLLSGEYDRNNAILKLNAGAAGGTESCDWAGMLYRMYTRWAEKKGFTVEVLDYLDGDEAGIKSVTFQINGENAYGYLKSEKGVHRLVRILTLQRTGQAADLLRIPGRYAGYRGRHQCGDPGRGSAYRYLPFQRSGRPAYQQDLIGDPYHPSAYRYRGTVPE